MKVRVVWGLTPDDMPHMWEYCSEHHRVQCLLESGTWWPVATYKLHERDLAVRCAKMVKKLGVVPRPGRDALPVLVWQSKD